METISGLEDLYVTSLKVVLIGLKLNVMLAVVWIALNENLGFCGAVNLAVQKTGTPYVILLNNDTETDKYFVEWLLRGIKKSDHIFSCGAQMIDYKNHEILDNAGDLYTAMGWAVARGKGRPCKDYETSKRLTVLLKP